MTRPLERARCALVGHHDWPFDSPALSPLPGTERCLRCGSAPPRRFGPLPWWRRLWPVGVARGRWHLTVRLGWPRVAALTARAVAREHAGAHPFVEARLQLWRLEVGARLGGLWTGEEDHARSLGGAWATCDTEGGAEVACRLLGHRGHDGLGTRWCDRCGRDLDPATGRVP